MRAKDVFSALTILAVASCDFEVGPNISGLPGYAIVSVEVTPSSDTILVSDTIRASDRAVFTATAFGRRLTPLSLSRFAWSTSDPSIAVVDSFGVVRPLRPGSVVVQASAHKVGTASLVIINATETVTVSPINDTIFVQNPIVPSRDTTRLKAQARNAVGTLLTGVAFTWQSSAQAVATVDGNGVVHAAGPGTTNVTVSANGRSAVAQVHVLPVAPRVALSNSARARGVTPHSSRDESTSHP